MEEDVKLWSLGIEIFEVSRQWIIDVRLSGL